MATIQENRKNGKLVSYKFTACVGRDAAGKQIRYYRTWTPPREYAPAKARKYAQLEAALWEQAIRKHGINSAQMPDSAAARCAEKIFPIVFCSSRTRHSSRCAFSLYS